MSSLKLLDLIRRAFGSRFVNQTIGTKTNIVKPGRFDTNAPTKALYNPKAFENDQTYDIIESQLMEYAPFQLSNKNSREVANYQANLEMYLKARNKRAGGSTEFVQAEEGTGEIIDLKTKSKVDDEGILSLKEKFGLPEGIDPNSERARFIQRLQRAETGSAEAESIAQEALEKIIGRGARGPDPFTEGTRRAVMRKILLNDTRINLPDDLRKSLKNFDDLKGPGMDEVDPLIVFEKFYVRDNNKLEALDDIIEGARTPEEAANEFLTELDGFDLVKTKQKPVVRESIDDELRELEDQEILGEDIDPDELAKGGRVGFKFGSGGKGIKSIIKMMSEKFGKDALKTADQVVVPDEVLSKTQRELQELDELRELYDNPMEFVKTVTPKFYERMELKIKYPGITDELIEKILADDNPQRKAEVLATMDEAFKMMEKGMSSDAILNAFKKTPRTKNAGGGLNYLMGM